MVSCVNVFLQKRNSVEKDEKDGRGDDIAEKKRVFAKEIDDVAEKKRVFAEKK